MNRSFHRFAVASLTGLAACGGPAAPRVTRDLTSAPPLDFTLLFEDVDLAPPLDMTMLAEDLTLSEDDLARPPDLATRYPPAPYGSNVGDTIAPLVWEGYNNPSAKGLANLKPYGMLAMNDLRTSGNRFALIYTADTF